LCRQSSAGFGGDNRNTDGEAQCQACRLVRRYGRWAALVGDRLIGPAQQRSDYHCPAGYPANERVTYGSNRVRCYARGSSFYGIVWLLILRYRTETSFVSRCCDAGAAVRPAMSSSLQSSARDGSFIQIHQIFTHRHSGRKCPMLHDRTHVCRSLSAFPLRAGSHRSLPGGTASPDRRLYVGCPRLPLLTYPPFQHERSSAVSGRPFSGQPGCGPVPSHGNRRRGVA
jgi:hypothetical protein